MKRARTPDSLTPCADWTAASAAWKAGARHWLPATAGFRNEMLGEVPRIQWHLAPGFGDLFAVGEIWRHDAAGQPVCLWFRSKPGIACRLATAQEIAAEVMAITKPAA